MDLRISGLVEESIVDGPGLRFVVFTQGCPHRCQGCHNPQTHDFSGGTVTHTDDILRRYRRNPMLQGITLSGGEPFSQPAPLAELCRALKQDDVHVMVYSGYTYEELLDMAAANPDTDALLSLCDVLVDGRFELATRSLMLKFRGSENQRIIDVPASLKSGHVIIKIP